MKKIQARLLLFLSALLLCPPCIGMHIGKQKKVRFARTSSEDRIETLDDLHKNLDAHHEPALADIPLNHESEQPITHETPLLDAREQTPIDNEYSDYCDQCSTDCKECVGSCGYYASFCISSCCSCWNINS